MGYELRTIICSLRGSLIAGLEYGMERRNATVNVHNYS